MYPFASRFYQRPLFKDKVVGFFAGETKCLSHMDFSEYINNQNLPLSELCLTEYKLSPCRQLQSQGGFRSHWKYYK